MENFEIESRQEKLEEYESRKKARQIQVSTDDLEVKAQLRQLGEPICLFGEGPADRRARLKELVAVIGQDALKKKDEAKPKHGKSEAEKVTWYHEGGKELQVAREWIARYSIPRASARLKQARIDSEVSTKTFNNKLQELFKRNRTTSGMFSQIADQRPISHCQFSPNSQLLATSSWSGLCKLWSVPECATIRTFRAHPTRVCCITFHPHSTIDLDPSSANLATCSIDGQVKLWPLDSEESVGSLKGQEPHRVSKCAFHPSGRFLGTCCFDYSWRLWDVERRKEILHQEGHSKEVYDIAFQTDGSLALTGGMDGYGRVWDLRTGRCIMFLEGHLKSILAVDFSPNGYLMASGSEDHSVKIWDLRYRKNIYTIPAHNSLVSRVKFQNTTGYYLVTASYDQTAKVWNHPNWSPSQVLSNQGGRIMCVDISNNDAYIATSTYNKSFNLWVPMQ